jgi:hypothetical protein
MRSANVEALAGMRFHMVAKYDFFSGVLHGKDAFWVGCTECLEKAKEQMNEMAAETPGPFFVFSVSEQRVVAEVDTSRQERGAASGR